jgi:transcriptional regulator with XRE-family HTH domain
MTTTALTELAKKVKAKCLSIPRFKKVGSDGKEEVCFGRLAQAINDASGDKHFVTRSYLSQWLRGTLDKDPSDEKIKKIADVIGMDNKVALNYSERRSRPIPLTKGTLVIQQVFYEKLDDTKAANDVIEKLRTADKTKWDRILKILEE